MLCARKLVLVIHRDRDTGHQITKGLFRRRVPACLVSDPGKLARLVQTFRIHYLIIDVDAGSPLDLTYRDWSSTPSVDDEAIPVLNLNTLRVARPAEPVLIDAICQTVAGQLA